MGRMRRWWNDVRFVFLILWRNVRGRLVLRLDRLSGLSFGRGSVDGLSLGMKLLVPHLFGFTNQDNKGLVPEGYVRFLNEEEERQYLEQSPPSNTLLPKNQMVQSGEATPRVTNQSVIQSKWEQHHQQEDDEGEWVDEPDDSSATETAGGDWVGLTTGVDHIQVER